MITIPPAPARPAPTPGAGPRDSARYFRPAGLAGLEALHAYYRTHRYAPHLHQAWTLALIDHGAATFDLEGARHVAAAGTVAVIPPDAVHTGEPASPLGYRYRAAYLDVTASPGWLPGQLRARPRHPPPAVIRHPELATALARLHHWLDLPGRDLERGEALTAVTALLAALALGHRDHRPAAPPAVARALDYIRTHWADDFTLPDLARHAGLSPFHLTRTFRQHTGVPPSAYRRALRVRAAQNLLRAGSPPAQAAEQCGFYDQAHLNKHFKAATGITPRQYTHSQP